MTAAVRLPSMKRSPEQNEIAETPLQILPVFEAGVLAGAQRQGVFAGRARRDALPELSPSPELAGAPWMPSESQLAASSLPLESSPTPEIRPAQRLESGILNEVGLVRRTGADSMEVSLRPDAQTELRLRLIRHGDQVEAVVSVTHGETESLKANWASLRERLQVHGIQLRDLGAPSPPVPDSVQMTEARRNGTAGDSSGQGRRPWAENLENHPFAPRMAPGVTVTEKPSPRRSRVSRLLESWA